MALTDPHAVQLIDEVVQGNKRLLLGVVRPLGGTEPPEGAVNCGTERRTEPRGQELQRLEVGRQIQAKVRARVDQNQREEVLRGRRRVSRQELGEEEGVDELPELGGRAEAVGLHDEAKKV